MSKTKFTPGPWKVGNYTDFIEIHSDTPAGLKEVCYMDDWTDGDEALANARLIAKAPKMFNVLKKCLDYLKRCPMTRNAGLEREIEILLEIDGEGNDEQ